MRLAAPPWYWPQHYIDRADLATVNRMLALPVSIAALDAQTNTGG